MKSYLDRIKQLKNERKMTNERLSELTGIPLGTLSKILAGMSDSPKLSNIVAICSALDCSIEYIVSGTQENNNNYTLDAEEILMIESFRRLDAHGKSLVQTVVSMEEARALAEAETSAPATAVREAAPKRTQRESARILRPVAVQRGRYAGESVRTEKRPIDLYELPVSAGIGDYLESAAKDSISIPVTAKTAEASYALRISGNSMEPKYHDGDVLLVKETDGVEVGELGIFLLDGCGFFKVYGGDRLISLNPEYAPILLKEFADVQFRGQVIGKLKRK